MVRALLLLLASVLGGCVAPQADDAPGGNASGARASAGSPASGKVLLPARRSAAALIDRGEILAYGAGAARRDGAYTWHPVEVSEAHALAAISGGALSLTAPDGTPLRFRYGRHVEHPSGDWTWIGRAAGASGEAIITFGERAVFATISQPGKAPLRLTSAEGRTWLVETDRRAIAGIDNAATRPKSPGFLMAPKGVVRERSAEWGVGVGTAASSVGSMAGPGRTVDLVVGYTSGYAAGLGGQSQALTRLNFLVEVANQGYVNSQLDARLRLVHAMQVEYADATANGTALEELTGFRAPSTPTTPNAAFMGLRAARDQYGGDLVALVRKFSEPENDGCGIAWLIGGDESGIDTGDEYFGYSVVSDGQDQGADGKTYFCRDESLAHEVGHNMGSQHDRATATVNGVLKYGVYPYSFGHKTAAAAGNFYTIMAYGDQGQVGYRTFSNPRSTYCGGNPCGVQDQADNARSIDQTLPLVAQFRATRVSDIARNPDVNGDGKSELFFRNFSDGLLAYWLMDGPTFIGASTTSAPAGFDLATSGDFNNDNRLDLVWLRRSDRNLVLWTGVGNGFTSSPVGGFGEGWNLVGRGDVNADGNTDLFFRNSSLGTLAYWLMSGPVFVSAANFGAPAGYEVALTGDFNGDRRVDVLWNRAADRNLLLYSGNPAGGFNVGVIGGYGAGWVLVGRGDVNGDGRADLLFRNPGSGWLAYWLMDGAVFLGASAIPSPPGHELEVTGDYNGDGRVDLVWVRASDRNITMWLGTGSGFTTSPVGGFGTGWSISNVAN